MEQNSPSRCAILKESPDYLPTRSRLVPEMELLRCKIKYVHSIRSLAKWEINLLCRANAMDGQTTGAMWRRLIRSLWILSRHCKWKTLDGGTVDFQELELYKYAAHCSWLASSRNYTLDNYELDNYSNPVRNPFSRRCSRYFVVAGLCSSWTESAVCKSSWKNSITISTSILWACQTEWPSSSSSDHGSKQYKWKRSSGRQNSNPCPSLFKRPGHPFNCPLPIYPWPAQPANDPVVVLCFKSFSIPSSYLSCCTLARSQP